MTKEIKEKAERLGDLMERSGQTAADASESMAENPTEKLLNEVEVKEAEKVEPKKQKISASYTLRAFRENVRKLRELKLITEGVEQELYQLQEVAMINWMKNEYQE